MPTHTDDPGHQDTAGNGAVSAGQNEPKPNGTDAPGERPEHRERPAPALLALGEGFVATPTIAKLAGALARAQANLGPLHADKTAKVRGQKNGRTYEYTYTYAGLADALAAALPALSAEALALTQSSSFDGRTVTVYTLLAHESGEWMRATLKLQPKDATPQSVGSAITYARRYALLGMVGLAPDDDDGQAAAHGNGGRTQKAKPPQNVKPPPQGGDDDELAAEVADIRKELAAAKDQPRVEELGHRIHKLPQGAEKTELLAAAKRRWREVGVTDADAGDESDATEESAS